MITEIEMKNVKGQTTIQSLTGKDIFIGRNGSGKTTRIQSLGLAMLGYVPGQGKTTAETFKLATGDNMLVGLKTEEFEFKRKFTREEKLNSKTGETKVSIKENLSVSPGQGERTATQKKERIATEVGNFPVALDFNEFLSLSGAKRRDFIYSLSPITSDTWDKERLSQYLTDRMLTSELQENNQEQYNITKELIDEVLNQYKDNLSIHDGLLSMIDWTTTELSFWKRKQIDSQGAVRQMADMKNQLLETDRNISDSKKELEELQQSLIEVEKKIAADTEKKQNIDRRLARIEELKNMIETIKNEPIETDVSEIEKKIGKLQTTIPLPVDVQSQVFHFNNVIAASQEKLSLLRREEAEIQEQMMTIRSTIHSLESSLEKVGELGGACIINKMIACPKDFTGFDQYIDGHKVKANSSLQQLQDKQNEFKTKINELIQIINENERAKTDLFNKAQEVQKRREEMHTEIKELEKEREKRLTATERKEHKISIHQEELSRLMNEKSEPIGDLNIMKKQVEGTRNRIGELENSVQEKEKSKQALLLMQQNVLENKESEYKTAGLKAIQESLGPRGVQGELVKEVLEPIRLQIEENLNLMEFEQQPYFQTESDTGQEIFEFGWINNQGHKVNFDALSTGQQTVYLAAMMMTIIDRAKPKLRILVMDNLNHLDKQNFQLLVNGLDKLVDKVDNIILAGALEYDFEAEGWQVDNLSIGGELDDKKTA